jgi:hypothetical protein
VQAQFVKMLTEFLRQETKANALIGLGEDMAHCYFPVNIAVSYFLSSSVSVSFCRQMLLLNLTASVV